MTYVEVNEAHRKKSIVYLARHFSLRPDQVQYMGEIEPGAGPFRFICGNHRETFGIVERPSSFIAPPVIVELSQEFWHEDLAANRVTTILVGQCTECGNVLMAEARYNPF